MNTYCCVYLGSLVLSILLTPLVIRLARRIGAVDQPGIRSVHKLPVPRIGGVAIFLSATALITSVVFLDNNIGQAFRNMRLQLITLLSAATFIFLVGLIDDLRGLPARCKFVAELLVTFALCLSGIRISEIALTEHWVLPLGACGGLLTVLWIVKVV